MPVFTSHFSKTYKTVLGFVFAIVIATTIPILNFKNYSSFFIVLTINLSVISLLLWIIIATSYTINNNQLICKSGPFHETISILNIKKISPHKGLFIPVTFKPALSHIGLIISYNYCDNIYISPKEEKKFVEKLLELNPAIQIEKTKHEL